MSQTDVDAKSKICDLYLFNKAEMNGRHDPMTRRLSAV